MRFHSPFKDKPIDESLFYNNEGMDKGLYPIGTNGFWHGGVHLVDNNPVVAVADGWVLAYRINDKYLKNDHTKHDYSSGFVLMGHELKTPKGQVIRFFSLYLHLLPWGAYDSDMKKEGNRPAFFNATRYFAKEDLTIFTDFNSSRWYKPTRSDYPTIVTKSEVFWKDPVNIDTPFSWDKNNKFRQLHPERHGGDDRWALASTNLINIKKNLPMLYGEVVVLESPMQVNAGQLIGYPGQGYEKQESIIHLEIFTDSVSFMDNASKDELVDESDEKTNLYDWKKYFKVFSETDMFADPNDGYCDCLALTEKLIKLADPKQKSLMESTADPILAVQDKYLKEYLRQVVSCHPTEWEKSVQQSFSESERLLQAPYFIPKEEIQNELVPVLKEMEWWTQVQRGIRPPGTFVLPDPKKVWYFHPVKFIEHLIKLSPKISLEFVNEKGKTAKVESAYLVYDEKGNLIHDGRFKSGKSEFSDFELDTNKKYCVWLDESVGTETIFFKDKVFRKYEVKREHYSHDFLYYTLEVPDWYKKPKSGLSWLEKAKEELKFDLYWQEKAKLDRNLEVNGPNGPAGAKNIQRHRDNYITKGDIVFIPLPEIKVNKVNSFFTEEQFETWFVEETDIALTSNAISTVGPDSGEIKYMAASMSCMVTFYNKKRRKAYKLRYHMRVKAINEGIDLNIISASLSKANGTKKFRKGIKKEDIFDSYLGNSYVTEFSTPLEIISVGRFSGDRDQDGHKWRGFFISGGLGLSSGFYKDLVLKYWYPNDTPEYTDISDTRHANFLFSK